MALDAYMCFDPPTSNPCGKNNSETVTIKGETSDDVGVKVYSFQITSFDWGASQRSPYQEAKKTAPETTNTGPIAGFSDQSMPKITVEKFSVAKPIDTASLYLFQACVTEDCSFKKATVVFRKMGVDGKPFVYLAFEFETVCVEKIDWDVSDDVKEKLDFNFEKCTLFYTPQTVGGDKVASFKTTKKSVSWSRKA